MDLHTAGHRQGVVAAPHHAAVEAGREAYEIGLAPHSGEAQPTSPLTGFLNER